MKDYIQLAKNYAKKVKKEGKKKHCKHVLNAAKRFEKDLKRKDITINFAKPGKEKEANRWCAFLERLPHVKGKWASK